MLKNVKKRCCNWIAVINTKIAKLLDIRIIIRLHELAKTEQSGTPKVLAQKLSLSERTVFSYLSFMKTELNAPIIFNTNKGSYCYTSTCDLCFYG